MRRAPSGSTAAAELLSAEQAKETASTLAAAAIRRASARQASRPTSPAANSSPNACRQSSWGLLRRAASEPSKPTAKRYDAGSRPSPRQAPSPSTTTRPRPTRCPAASTRSPRASPGAYSAASPGGLCGVENAQRPISSGWACQPTRSVPGRSSPKPPRAALTPAVAIDGVAWQTSSQFLVAATAAAPRGDREVAPGKRGQSPFAETSLRPVPALRVLCTNGDSPLFPSGVAITSREPPERTKFQSRSDCSGGNWDGEAGSNKTSAFAKSAWARSGQWRNRPPRLATSSGNRRNPSALQAAMVRPWRIGAPPSSTTNRGMVAASRAAPSPKSGSIA